MNHLEHHKMLSDQQHGFRKNSSCETQLILNIDDLAKCVDDHGQTDAILSSLNAPTLGSDWREHNKKWVTFWVALDNKFVERLRAGCMNDT